MNSQVFQQAVVQIFCLIFLFWSQVGAKTLDAEEAENLNAIKKLKRVKRVINGWEVEAGQWPWLVHLRGERETGSWWNRNTQKYYCGGSIVSDRYILTAAHCFKQGGDNQLMQPKAWHVTHGDIDWNCNGVWEGIQHFWCRLTGQSSCRCHLHNEMIFIHPNYNAEDYWANDIALLKVEDSILDKDNTAIVPLPRSGEGTTWPAPGSQCICKGWGCTSGGGPVTEFARAVGLASYDNTQCAAFYTSRNNPVDIQARMCAFKSGNGICSGDSGGPLVCKDSNNNWMQAGVVSFAAATAPELSPAVFARVSNYMDWINLVTLNF